MITRQTTYESLKKLYNIVDNNASEILSNPKIWEDHKSFVTIIIFYFRDDDFVSLGPNPVAMNCLIDVCDFFKKIATHSLDKNLTSEMDELCGKVDFGIIELKFIGW